MIEPTGFTIFCDDIREEVNGKLSLIGCYGADLRIFGSPLPILLPKLGFHITIRLPTDGPNLPLKIMIYLPGQPDDQPALTADATIPDELIAEHKSQPRDPKWDALIGSEPVFRGVRQHFVLSPVAIIEEGLIRVRLLYGDTRIRAGALKVLVEKETVTPPPTST